MLGSITTVHAVLMVRLFHLLCSVLLLFSQIIVEIAAMHCRVPPVNHTKVQTLVRRRFISAPPSIVPVTILVNVCHDDPIPTERENKLLILIFLYYYCL